MKKSPRRIWSATNQKLLGQKKTIQSHIKSVGKRKQARRDSKNR